MSPKPNQFSKFLSFAKLAVLVGIVLWIVTTFPKKDWDSLVAQEKNWWLLGQAFFVVLLAHLVTYWRWQILVQALGVPMRLAEAVRLGFLGTLLNLVSVGAVGGDVFKAIEAARNTDKKRAEVVASVLVDRAVGLLGLVLIASVSLSFAQDLSIRMTWIWYGAMVLGLIGLSGMIAIVILGHRFPIKWLTRIPIVGHVLHRVVHACMIFQGRPRLVCEMLISSLVVHSCLTLGCTLISNSLYSKCPSIGQHFMTIPPAMAAATLPITPGGVGVQEIAIQSLFNEWPDIPANYSGLIMATVLRAMLICIALIGAVYYFTGMGGEKRKIVASS
ncbi:MAG: lysylphosphatidylglycerol synthase transmembrane domain-containing protein [Pirellula sp.]